MMLALVNFVNQDFNAVGCLLNGYLQSLTYHSIYKEHFYQYHNHSRNGFAVIFHA